MKCQNIIRNTVIAFTLVALFFLLGSPDDTRAAEPPVAPKLEIPPKVSTPQDELLDRYRKAIEELSRRLPETEMKRRVEVLEKELATAKAKEEQIALEKIAADELTKVKNQLEQIAKKYPDTSAGRRAKDLIEFSPIPALPVQPSVPVPVVPNLDPLPKQ